MPWNPICMITGHRPDRNRAWHDNMHYRAPCRVCGTAMVRARDGWRKFDPDSNDSPDLATHPHLDSSS